MQPSNCDIKLTHRLRSDWIARTRLWRNSVSECVGMKLNMITQPVPGAVLFGSLRDAIFLAHGEVFPRIVASDGQKRPGGAFQMLHQDVADSRVSWTARRFAQHRLHLLPMTGSRAIVGNGINR